MSPTESRSNTNRNEIRLLKSDELNKTCLNEKWSRLKIICEQKFNRINQFGLNFIKLYSEKDNPKKLLNNLEDEEDETEQEQSKIGTFFAKKQAEKKLKTNPSDEIPTNDQSQIMKNIVFVLSGFQNPLRSELRNKAISMGAIYNEDWDEKCTHLM
jgi:DNA-repair protein XRCC1